MKQGGRPVAAERGDRLPRPVDRTGGQGRVGDGAELLVELLGPPVCRVREARGAGRGRDGEAAGERPGDLDRPLGRGFRGERPVPGPFQQQREGVLVGVEQTDGAASVELAQGPGFAAVAWVREGHLEHRRAGPAGHRDHERDLAVPR